MLGGPGRLRPDTGDIFADAGAGTTNKPQRVLPGWEQRNSTDRSIAAVTHRKKSSVPLRQAEAWARAGLSLRAFLSGAFRIF